MLALTRWNASGWDEAIPKATEHVCCHQIIGAIGGASYLRVSHCRKEERKGWINNCKIEPDVYHALIEKLREHSRRTVERILGGKRLPGWLQGPASVPFFQCHPCPMLQVCGVLVAAIAIDHRRAAPL